MTWESLTQPAVIWFIVALGLFLLEFILPGLIVFFFGLGATLTAVLCLAFDLSINTQLAIFIVASIAFLLGLRKWMEQVFQGKSTADNMDEYVGERAEVIEAIDPVKGGKVEFHGTGWRAEAGEAIGAGAVVEITGHQNLCLKVKKI